MRSTSPACASRSAPTCAAAKIKATVTGRPKHYYSVYQKMIVRGRDFEEIYDLVAVRVLVETVRDCYAALGALHARWNPVPGRFKDYIAMPKFNMYQSLHTTVIGPEGKPVEIQIRTHTMHRRAEYGVAAHWKYKEDTSASAGPALSSRRRRAVNDMAWLRQLLDWQRETADPGEFLDSLRFEINAGEVYVFTPKGEVVALPGRLHPGRLRLRGAHRGRAPLHRRPGQRPARAAGVDARERRRRRGAHLQGRRRRAVARLAPVRQERAGAQQDPPVVLQGAPRGGDRRAARTRSPRRCASRGLPLQRLMSVEALAGVAAELRYPDIDGLYAAVGEGHVSAASTSSTAWSQSLGGEEGASEDLAEATVPTRARTPARPATRGRRGRGGRRAGSSWPSAAPRCPGDPILGFVTRGNGVSVHRRDCTNADSLLRQPDRLIDVEWAPSASSVFLVQLQVEALDRNRLLSDVTRVLSDQHVNILSASVQTSRDRVALSRFTFEMGEPSHLDHVIRAVRRIDGVFDVYRITGGKTQHAPV